LRKEECMKGLLGVLACVILASTSLTTKANTIAYTDPAGQGTQVLGNVENLALNFDVNSPVTVTALGVFNASGSGTITGAPIQVVIFDTTTNTEVTPVVTFQGSYVPAGLGYDVFQAIAPVVLETGAYEVDALWNGTDPNGNLNSGSTGPILNSGGGALTFTGASYDASAVLDDPLTCSVLGPCQPPPAQSMQFDAGTFEFTPGVVSSVPEPAPCLLLFISLGAIVVLHRLRFGVHRLISSR
jgi:hypothetical protein